MERFTLRKDDYLTDFVIEKDSETNTLSVWTVVYILYK